MSETAIINNHQDEIENTSTGLSNKKLMMWLFLASDVMFFGAFISTYLIYRGKSLVGPYPSQVLDIPITTVSTFILLMSSLAMVLALHYEFNHFAHLGLTPRTNIFGTTFFILTGLHGGHVTIGIIWMAFLAYGSHKGTLRSNNAIDLEIAGLYWHFVDIVWIIIFTVIYLISANDMPPAGAELLIH